MWSRMPAVPRALVGQLGQFCDVRSNTFRVDVTATVNSYSRYFTAILGRNGPRDVPGRLELLLESTRRSRSTEVEGSSVPRNIQADHPGQVAGDQPASRQRQRRPRLAAF